MFKLCSKYALVFLLFVFPVFSQYSYGTLVFEKYGGTMAATGEISAGDYKRFVKEYGQWGEPPTVYAFDSNGGNVIEAMAIANFVRGSRIPVWITGKCYSACAFIYLAASEREARGEIGLHRPYYDKAFFSELSSYDAELKYKNIENITYAFLREIGVSETLIDIIKSTPSDKAVVYRGIAETGMKLGSNAAFMEEWNIAKCGVIDELTNINSCAYNWLMHLLLNSEVEGFRERVLADQDSEYRKNMPFKCQKDIEKIQILAMKALREDKIVLLKPSTDIVFERGKCLKKAEDDEVFSFFRALKKDKKIQIYYNREPWDIVNEKYHP